MVEVNLCPTKQAAMRPAGRVWEGCPLSLGGFGGPPPRKFWKSMCHLVIGGDISEKKIVKNKCKYFYIFMAILETIHTSGGNLLNFSSVLYVSVLSTRFVNSFPIWLKCHIQYTILCHDLLRSEPYPTLYHGLQLFSFSDHDKGLDRKESLIDF